MAKLFRLACSIAAYLTNPDKTQRPPKPFWLSDANRVNATRNQKHSFEYWTKIYWATPPWITYEQIRAMAAISVNCPRGHHIDHIVPLSSPIVCGLNVPWNLQHLAKGPNLLKSNHIWPGHPCENVELFETAYEPHQQRLAL